MTSLFHCVALHCIIFYHEDFWKTSIVFATNFFVSLYRKTESTQYFPGVRWLTAYSSTDFSHVLSKWFNYLVFPCLSAAISEKCSCFASKPNFFLPVCCWMNFCLTIEKDQESVSFMLKQITPLILGHWLQGCNKMIFLCSDQFSQVKFQLVLKKRIKFRSTPLISA